tara:strand:- start:272 stop:424 length:153 start_codon:yes stop_codon:yes gene_type:complete
MSNPNEWQTITELKESLQESADLNDTQSRAVTLLIEMAYNVGKSEILAKV